MQWYYAVGGQQQGPVEWEVLVSLARDGKLNPSDLVWTSTMGSQWSKASTVPGLFGPAPTAAGDVPPSVSEWSDQAKFKSSTHNRDLMAAARTALDGQWGLAVGANVLYFIVAIGIGLVPYIGSLVSLVVSGPLVLGWYMLFLALSRRQSAGVGMIFEGFKQFGTGFLAYLLIALLIFAWSLPAITVVIVGVVMGFMNLKSAVSGATPHIGMLLFLIPLFMVAMIPAIMAQYRYSMTYFAINETPGLGPLEAIRHSSRMMDGNKWKFFCLQWRFFWWSLLCILTFGIGFLWLMPYMMTSVACFYDDLRKGQTSP